MSGISQVKPFLEMAQQELVIESQTHFEEILAWMEDRSLARQVKISMLWINVIGKTIRISESNVQIGNSIIWTSGNARLTHAVRAQVSKAVASNEGRFAVAA